MWSTFYDSSFCRTELSSPSWHLRHSLTSQSKENFLKLRSVHVWEWRAANQEEEKEERNKADKSSQAHADQQGTLVLHALFVHPLLLHIQVAMTQYSKTRKWRPAKEFTASETFADAGGRKEGNILYRKGVEVFLNKTSCCYFYVF